MSEMNKQNKLASSECDKTAEHNTCAQQQAQCATKSNVKHRASEFSKPDDIAMWLEAEYDDGNNSSEGVYLGDGVYVKV